MKIRARRHAPRVLSIAYLRGKHVIFTVHGAITWVHKHRIKIVEIHNRF